MLGIFTSIFTAAVAGLVSWHSWRFVADEWEFGSVAFSGVPAWMTEVVIPMAFGFIALRYGLRTVAGIKSLLADGGDDGEPVSPATGGGCAVIAMIALALLALLGTPLFAIIAASAMLGFSGEEVDLQVMGIEIYRLAETPVLLAIPLFTFAGYLLGESGAPARLVGLTRAVLGWLSGGLAIVSLVACALFTAFTGASGVTIVALGALLYPALREARYPDKFSLGLITTSGSLGLLFAPALPLILYGVVAQQMNLDQAIRIDDLFAAGLLPGLLMVALLAVYSMWRVLGRGRDDARVLLGRRLRGHAECRLGNSASHRCPRRDLQGVLRAFRSGRSHRSLRIDHHRWDSPGNFASPAARNHARIHGSGRGDSHHPGGLHGFDQLPD